MSWNHAVLEIYQNENEWPKEGTPAEWIEKKLVLYCDGEAENLVLFIPLWKIVWWKLNHGLHNLGEEIIARFEYRFKLGVFSKEWTEKHKDMWIDQEPTPEEESES